MSFQNLGFLLLALPLAGAVIALYLLRMRRKDLVVPASFLWPSRTDEVRANSLFQKLKPNLLLFLQLAALFLVVGALAQPQCLDKGLAGKVTVMVLDASASMTAVDSRPGPSRFDEALNVARQAVASASPGDRLALIWAGPTPRVVFPLSSDPARQRLAMKGLAPVEAQSDMGEAMRLASAIVAGAEGAQILVLSDGVFPPVLNFSPGKAGVRFQKVGKPSVNVAVDAFGVNPESGRALLSLKAYGGSPPPAAASIYADGELIDSAKVEFSGGRWSRTFAPPRGARVIEAKIDAKDALAADNYAAAAASPQSSIRALLVGQESLFLERALSLEPRVILDKAAALPDAVKAGPPGRQAYDLVIFNGAPPEEVKAKGVLVFGPVSPVAHEAGAADRPRWTENSDHPVMADVDLEGLYVEKASILQPGPEGQIISSSSAGGWMAASRGSTGTRVVHVGFLLEDTDFPLKVSFPIFLYRCLAWLAGPGSAGSTIVSPGRAFAVNSTPSAADLVGPNGWKGRAEVSGGRAVAPQLPFAGAYKAAWKGGQSSILASFHDPEESALAPADSLSLGGTTVKGRASIQRLADVWKPFLLACLVILAAEWWLFARRS